MVACSLWEREVIGSNPILLIILRILFNIRFDFIRFFLKSLIKDCRIYIPLVWSGCLGRKM